MANKSNGPTPGRTKFFLGRTPKRLGKLLLFYFTFYSVLASQFSICLATRVKRLQQEYSLIGSSPALEFRPLPKDARSTLISYKGTSYESYKYWEDQLKELFSDYKQKYHNPASAQNLYNCDFTRSPSPGKVCDVDMRGFEPCTEENHFNYHRSAPCIFLKLNKIHGWRPEFYNDTSFLPEDMPEDLQSQIRNMTALNRDYGKMVWVSCQGETPADREFIGPIRYLPYPGFPGYFFPYSDVEGYMSPLVAVQFMRPQTGIVINIECRAWARNIQYNRKDHLGAVHFELMID